MNVSYRTRKPPTSVIHRPEAGNAPAKSPPLSPARGIAPKRHKFRSSILFRFEVRDFRSFSSDGLRVGNVNLPLSRFSGEGTRTPWVYFADQAHPGAPRGAIRLPLPADVVYTQYNPDGEVPTLLKLLKLPHVKQLDDELGPAMTDAQRIFNDDPVHARNPDTGTYGKLLHREAALRMRDKPRWQTNVWIRLEDKEVLSVNDPDFNGGNGTMEVDLAYMKRGKSIDVKKKFKPDDVVHAFEIKTSYTGTISEDQLDKYQRVLGGRDPVKVHVPKRQERVGRLWKVVDNPKAQQKIRVLQHVAVGAVAGFGVFNTAMALASAGSDEEIAYQDLVLAIQIYQRVRGRNDAEAKLALIDITDKMRIWLAIATSDSRVADIATLVFTLEVITREWQ